MAGVFGGGSATTDRKNQLAGFGTLADTMYFGQYGPGKGAVTAGVGGLENAQNFFNQLLSGNPAGVLGPQISTLQQQGAQRKLTGAEFGSRSGGTAAANQQIDINTTQSIDNLIATLTGEAATGLASTSGALGGLGLSTLGLGTQAAVDLSSLAGADYARAKAQQNANIASLLDIATLGVLHKWGGSSAGSSPGGAGGSGGDIGLG